MLHDDLTALLSRFTDSLPIHRRAMLMLLHNFKWQVGYCITDISVRFSLKADIGLMSVRFVPGADIADTSQLAIKF